MRSLDHIRIVLINTSHPGNIGGTARAIKNMGLSRLYLVEPKDFPNDRARYRAASALDILTNATICKTLDEAVADCNLVVGASARDRSIPWPVMDPRETAETIFNEPEGHEIAILFGREDRGLTNSELQRCHFHLQIPSNPEYSSLNLAAAVQVACYELRMAALKEGTPKNIPDWGVNWDVRTADTEEIQRFFVHLEETLTQLKVINPKNPRQLMTRLKRLYLRSRPDMLEVNILRGILTATQRHLK